MFGNCGIDMDAIVVNWVDMNNSGGMKLTFTFNRPEKKYTLSEIAFYFSAAVLHIDDNETLNIFYRGDILESSMGQSYCPRANYSLPLINEYRNRSIPLGTLELFSLCFEAHSICEDQLFCDYSAKSISMFFFSIFFKCNWNKKKLLFFTVIASSIIGAIALSSVFICLLCICRCITRCFKGYTPIWIYF